MTSTSSAARVGGRWGAGPSTSTSYSPWRQLWAGFDAMVAGVADDSGGGEIGELGGGCNPTVGLLDLVSRPSRLTVVDISEQALAGLPEGVGAVHADLCAPTPPIRDRFDLVFSRMLCEHVASAPRFHRNVFAALRPGGHAVHFFPSVTALPFLVNRLLPATLARGVVGAMFPARRRDERYGWFPARYSWCWGPVGFQTERYRSVGFDVVSTHVGVGHGYYDGIPGLRGLERAKARLTLRWPTPWLAAYVVVVLRRPAASDGAVAPDLTDRGGSGPQ